MPVLGKKKGYELGMNHLVVAEITSEKTAYEIAVNRGIITWKMYIFKSAKAPIKNISRPLIWRECSKKPPLREVFEVLSAYRLEIRRAVLA